MGLGISDSGIVIGAGRTERAVALDVVRDFLDALGRRDLDAARALLAPGFVMTVSGNHQFRRLEDFVAFSAGRNGPVRKSVDGLEASEAPTGLAVYATGTMSGSWLDGTAFHGIRWCDRFVLRDGRIVEMQFWNDMAEFRPR
ncbi:MAG: nuclear transport factor 2 family protein [Steroidobacteraceae bacterium]|jgi:ketosteroid isomerase-like protein|nr:nuclear transport factor 2 family protein [Steroidobacteraceae bacterium]